MATLARASRPRGLVLSPDDDAVLAARAAIRSHLLSFAAAEEGARAGEVEPVHQLRVATRRLRATLRLFAPILARTFVEAAHRDLAWLGSGVGGTRDLDVLFTAVKTRARRLDAGLREGLGPLGVAIQECRAEAHETLLAALQTPRCQRLLRRLTAFVESPARRRPRRLGDVAPDLVRPLARAVRRAGRALDPAAPPDRFHRLRVRVKRLRYGLETLRGLGGKPIRRLLEQLETMQSVLGDAQDAITQIAWLRAWATAPEVAAEVLLPIGALMQILARRGAKRRRQSLRLWRRMERDELLERALEELRAGARRGEASRTRVMASA
jgi:CHAD domain-containing protein